VVLAGVGGTASVIAANGWMNLPGGITLRSGRVVDVAPLAVYFNRAFPYEFIHMLLAAYMVAGFTVAGVYAAGMLKGRTDRYHHLGFLIPFTIAAVATPLQIVTGDITAREVFHEEPAKFAALELLPRTGDHARETIGGVLVDGRVRYGVEIPNLASLLAGYSADTRIHGLDAIPTEVRPNDRLVSIVHLSYDLMVAIGFALLGLCGWFALAWRRRRGLPTSRWFLRGAAVSGVASIVALQAGWVVTEVGRQPWTVVGLLLTRDASRTTGSLWPFFSATVVLYTAVGVATVFVLRGMRRRWAALDAEDVPVPYGPDLPLEPAVAEPQA
jgi:cytochrome d ubiquinol oxidase subunit I